MGSFLKGLCSRLALGWTSTAEEPPPQAWMDGGVEIARRKAGRGCSVYLLFRPAVAAHERPALLNWALNAHTAALKLPDG